MRRLFRQSFAFAFSLLVVVAGTVALTASPASAAPLNNRVTETAFIWNCPTGAPGCSTVQTRVGDTRVGDPLTDVCKFPTAAVAKNLVYNRTTRGGAAERTGFLYRRFLATPNLQTDSCTTGGGFNSAPIGTVQRLCPYTTCGVTGRVTKNTQTMREFCDIVIAGVGWHLTVIVDNSAGGAGPFTAGFVHEDDLDNFTNPQSDCTRP